MLCCNLTAKNCYVQEKIPLILQKIHGSPLTKSLLQAKYADQLEQPLLVPALV